jgi:hypothetical protein
LLSSFALCRVNIGGAYGSNQRNGRRAKEGHGW